MTTNTDIVGKLTTIFMFKLYTTQRRYMTTSLTYISCLVLVYLRSFVCFYPLFSVRDGLTLTIVNHVIYMYLRRKSIQSIYLTFCVTSTTGL